MKHPAEAPGPSGWPSDLAGEALAMPLDGLVASPRARKAFARLGITNVRELLGTARERLLAVPGFGPRSLAALDRALAPLRRTGVATTAKDGLPPALELVPVALLAFPTESLGLSARLRRELADAGLHDLEALLRHAGQLQDRLSDWTADSGEIRAALDRLIAPALRSTVHALETGTLPALVEQCLSALGDDHRTLLVRRLGVRAEPLPVHALAVRAKTTDSAVRVELEAIREHLHAKAAGCLSRLFDAAQSELQNREGCLAAEHIPPGTLLHAPRSSGLRPDLALRLLAFCYPHQLHLDGEALTVVPRRKIARLARLLRTIGPARGKTTPLPDLENLLRERKRTVPRGVLERAMLRAGLHVRIDGERGEIVVRERRTRGDRLRTILVDFGRPLALDDLLFHYRDRHHKGHQGRILDALRSDPRFLEIGPTVYSLREWHQDELELVRAEAQAMTDKIVAEGGRHDLRELGTGLSERTLWLVRDCLVHDPRLRSLGRGCFCSRAGQHSRVLAAMLRDLRRALGELPRARFLQNQPESQRRLVAHLLRVNRLFVEPGIDRIDLLTNYPFNAERLANLVQRVQERLAENRGYATVHELATHLAATDEAGGFLNEHLLEDLLRRHAPFELLPGGLVALPSLGLQRWIRQRVRDLLRAAGGGMTVGELLAEAPELAEFEPCLRRLLEEDPTIASPDLLRFQIA